MEVATVTAAAVRAVTGTAMEAVPAVVTATGNVTVQEMVLVQLPVLLPALARMPVPAPVAALIVKTSRSPSISD